MQCVSLSTRSTIYQSNGLSRTMRFQMLVSILTCVCLLNKSYVEVYVLTKVKLDHYNDKLGNFKQLFDQL